MLGLVSVQARVTSKHGVDVREHVVMGAKRILHAVLPRKPVVKGSWCLEPCSSASVRMARSTSGLRERLNAAIALGRAARAPEDTLQGLLRLGESMRLLEIVLHNL